MKQVVKFFTVAGLLLIVNLTFAQEKSNPGMYMQYFSDHYKQVSQDMWDYMSAIARGKNAKKVESRRKELLKSLLDAKRRIAATKPFFGDAGLRDSTVSFLKLNYNILHEDYDKVLNLEEISEQSFDKMEAYILVRKATNEKMNAASDALEVEQDRFATEHHVNLIHDESKLGKKLARAGKAFNYYDELFLLYFKCQFQESNMINAMNKGDINAMEQSKNALLQFADEGLEPPEPKAVAKAIEIATLMSDQGLPPPLTVVLDPNGGVMFDWKVDKGTLVLHVWDDAEAEFYLFVGGKVVNRWAIE